MIGVANRPIWSRNGNANGMSLYFTPVPASQRPTPSATKSRRTTKSGKKTMCQLGRVLNHAKRPSRTTKERTKSTSGAATAAKGAYTRGKYALLIRGPLLTRLELAFVRADEKYVQGRRPA